MTAKTARIALVLSLATLLGACRTGPETTSGGSTAPVERKAKLSTGVELNYLVQGREDGIPVVLLHGFGDSLHIWSRNLPLLPEKYRVYALDLRGHGASSAPAQGYEMSDFAADVVAFMDQQGLKKPHLVAYAMGSLVAHHLAAKHPDRVDRLVLLSSGPTAAGNEVAAGFLPFLRDVLPTYTPEQKLEFAREVQKGAFLQPVPAEFMESAVAQTAKVPNHVMVGAMQGMLNDDHVSALSRITSPTLILHGEKNAIFTVADQEKLKAAIPNAKLKIYPNAGEGVHAEIPDTVTTDILNFLEGRS